MSLRGSYADGLTYRLVQTLKRRGVKHADLLQGSIHEEVCAVMEEIQHRLYQDVLAVGADLAADLNPPTRRV